MALLEIIWSRRLSENPHLSGLWRHGAHPPSLQRMFMYVSLMRISRSLHLHIFQQPLKFQYSDRLPAVECIETSNTRIN